MLYNLDHELCRYESHTSGRKGKILDKPQEAETKKIFRSKNLWDDDEERGTPSLFRAPTGRKEHGKKITEISTLLHFVY
jgi:hypothetical protein